MAKGSGFRASLISGLEQRFASVGKAVEASPYKAILFCVLTTMIAAAGMSNLYLETDSFLLFVPTGSPAYMNWDYERQNYVGGTREQILTIQAKDEGSILRYDVLSEILSIHKGITETVELATGEKYDWYCDRYLPTQPCQFENFLSAYDYSEATLTASNTAGNLLTKMNALSEFTQLENGLGSVVYDSNGDLESARVIRLRYVLDDVRTDTVERKEDIDGVRAFEQKLLDLYKDEWAADDHLTTITMFTERSVDDEVGRLLEVDSTLFALAIFMIVTALSISFWRGNMVESKSAMGFGAAFLIILQSCLFSFGLLGWFGIDANSLCFLIPFIVAGVGVDDMIVIESFYSQTVDKGIPAGERLEIAMKEAGLAIFLTSVSSVLAFLSGVFVDLPGVVGFCFTGAFCFFYIWFQAMTIFPAFLVITQRRIEAGGNCCCACEDKGCKDRSFETKKNDPLKYVAKPTFLGTHLAPILSNPIGAIGLSVAFIGFATFSLTQVFNLEVGLGVTDVVPDDSYIVDVMDVTAEHWSGDFYKSIQLVFKGDFYTDEAKIVEMKELFNYVETADFKTMTVIGKVGTIYGTWYDDYVEYMVANSLDQFDDSDFYGNIGAWINIPENQQYIGDVVCKSKDFDNCDEIVTSRFWFVGASPDDSKTVYIEENQLNDYFKASSFDGFAFHIVYGYADGDDIMPSYIVQNLAFATSVVFLLMFFLMDLPSAITILLCLIMIDLDLLGLMYLWDVKINSVSFSALVMSVGLSIDYNVHIAHAFLHAEASSVEERTKKAMDMIGGSVLKGAFTTLLGCIVLAFSSSTVFRIFFKLSFGTVIFGVLHGLIMVPIFLGVYVRFFPASPENVGKVTEGDVENPVSAQKNAAERDIENTK